MPLAQLPLIGPSLAAALDPPLRVLIEAGYDRTINPGQPTPAKFLYMPNPIKTAVDFIVAIPTGWDDAIASVTGNPADRPFHTTPQPTYGVGGPPVYTGAVDPYGPPTPHVAVPPAPAPAAKSTRDAPQSRPQRPRRAPVATASRFRRTDGRSAHATAPNRSYTSMTTAPP
jgi:hypothetical protein